jgi:hypothetical protein
MILETLLKLFFAYDLKLFHTVTSVTDSVLFQTDIDSVCGWCAINSVILNSGKTRVITFTRKTYPINYSYKLSDTNISHTDGSKVLGVVLYSELLFHHHVEYIFSKSLKTLGLTRMLTYSFSTIDSLWFLYVTLVRSILEYASAVWNSVMVTDAIELERVQLITIMLTHLRF